MSCYPPNIKILESYCFAKSSSQRESLSDVPDVKFLVNGIGKTKRTHLINALIEKKYIHENDAGKMVPVSTQYIQCCQVTHYIFNRILVRIS